MCYKIFILWNVQHVVVQSVKEYFMLSLNKKDKLNIYNFGLNPLSDMLSGVWVAAMCPLFTDILDNLGVNIIGLAPMNQTKTFIRHSEGVKRPKNLNNEILRLTPQYDVPTGFQSFRHSEGVKRPKNLKVCHSEPK